MSEVSIMLTPRDVAAALQLSRATVYRRIEDGTIRATRIGDSLRIPSSELDRLADNATSPAAAELEHIAPTPLVLQADGEWRVYETGEPVPPEELALFCRRPGPKKRPATEAFEDGERELARQRAAVRDFDRRLAVPVPVPFPRSGTAYIATRPLKLQDLSRNFRQLREGDLLHADEIAAAGKGLDELLAQGDVAAVPAEAGIVGLAGALLERVADLERQAEQLAARTDGGGA